MIDKQIEYIYVLCGSSSNRENFFIISAESSLTKLKTLELTSLIASNNIKDIWINCYINGEFDSIINGKIELQPKW